MKKRLLLVTSGFPFGESERSFLTEEAKQLADAFDLLILAPENRDQLLYPTDGIVKTFRYRIPPLHKSFSLSMLMHVFGLTTAKEVWNCWKKHRFSNLFQSFREIVYFRFCAWELEKRMAEIVETEKIDIVYTYWCTGNALGAVNLKRRFPNLKVITRFHGMDLYEERTKIDWQPFRKEIMHLADGLCFACEYGRTYFQERWGKECARKMQLFYLGSTDRGLMDMPEGECLRIVSCSNLIPLKRVELIVEGLALLPKTMQVQWYIFGDGTEREKLEKLAALKFSDCPNISWNFCGFVPNASLADHYRAIAPQLFITTSSTEGGAPVAIQEIFSMGIPAIGTPVGGIPDLILDGKTGFLLPQQVEPVHVAAAVERFAALTWEQKQQMRAAARQRWAEKFDAVRNAARVTRYLLELVSE